jgi:lipopolysaccharide transport system permease protein
LVRRATVQVLADLRDILTEQLAYRELLFRMTHRDLLLRYKQTVMGVGWAVFMPLVNTAVFSVIFMRVAPLDTGVPYPLYAYSGLMVWNAFASSLRFGVNSLTSNGTLITKIYFPREILPISAVLVTLVDTAVSSLVLVGLLAYYQVPVTSALLLLPVIVITLLLFTTAVALALAMANLFFRDVKYLFEIGITVWMFATSVVYPIEQVGGRLGALLALNPMVPLIDAFRSVVVFGVLPPAAPLAAVALVSVVALVASSVAFHRAEFRFAENL